MKIVFCSLASNRDDELRHEMKIDHEMKKIRIQIIFCQFCKLRKRSHISNVTFQRDHLSCLVRHMNQKKDNQLKHLCIDEKTCFRSNRILREKTSRRINSKKIFDHYYFHVNVKNHFKNIIFLV
jgi:hypothetical protein